MKKFNESRDRNFGDRGANKGGRRPERGGFTGGSRRDDSMMHKAVCFECGKDCQVPFKPTGSKPVFCSFCFGSKQDSERRVDNKFERNTSFKPRADNDSKKIDEVISRLDKIIKLLSPEVEVKKEEAKPVKEKKVTKKKSTKTKK